MKINKIAIVNFMRITMADITLSGGVSLFCGFNEVGKSTLQEAIRLACFDETVRVTKKGDRKMLVKDGAKKGHVLVQVGDVTIKRDVQSGALDKEVALPPEALKYCLDAHKFSRLSPDDRRTFLFKALKIGLKPDDIKKRLLAHGANEEYVNSVLPLMLSGGFTLAHSECKKEAAKHRVVWTTLTGEEKHGVRKGEDWMAEPLFNKDHEAELNELLHEKESTQGAIEEMIVRRTEIDSGKSHQHEGAQANCPECGTKLVYQMGALHKYVDEKDEKDYKVDSSEIDSDIQIARRRIAEIDDAVVRLKLLKERDADLEAVTKRAKHEHNVICEWVGLAALLAPDGIPAEIISEALKPVNDRLKQTSLLTRWATCQITPDLNIEVDGRPYTLQSESSIWRADAMIAEAISHLTNMGVLVLDRVDVLDLKSRSQLFKWVMKLTSYDSILLFATLKEAPKLPPSIGVYWLEDGNVEKVQ